VTRRLGFTVPLLAALLLAMGSVALAQGAERTTLSLAVPPRAALGQVAEVRARLTDASGAPIPKATILFTAPLAFLQAEGDVVLADAETDADGAATAEFEVRTEGRMTIRAVFRGDARYAPSSATAELAVEGSSQLYTQHAGVHLPGLNAGPAVVPLVRDGSVSLGLIPGTSRFWPALSGWPIALALMIIWSLYGSVVVLLFRVARAGKEGAEG